MTNHLRTSGKIADVKRSSHPQLTLPVSLEDTASFDNYLPLGNESCVEAVRQSLVASAEPASLFLWGPKGTGKSHLLIAACRQVQEQGGRARYLSALESSLSDLDPLNNDGLDLIAIDDVQALNDEPSRQPLVMQIYEKQRHDKRTLLFAATHQPAQLGLTLPDLATRLGAGAVFALHALDDEAKSAAISLRAQRRGFVIEPDVLAYALARLPRDNTTLFEFLDAIDNHSLARHRRITKRLVHELLNDPL